jgi:hypothetical protein
LFRTLYDVCMSGAKTKYRSSFPEMLIEHMGEGSSYTSFAAKIGVHIDTLYEWEKVHPKFTEAKKVAFSKSQGYWEDLGKKMAENGNAAVWKFNMKNRFGWRESENKLLDVKVETKSYGLAFDLSKHPDQVAEENLLKAQSSETN